jgi:hypothetical protein
MADEKKLSLENLKLYLEQQDYPRLQMTMMVMGTALAGMLASWVLMHMGVIHMGWRYGCSVICSYLAFLGLLRIWLHFEGRRIQVDLGMVDPEDVIDLVDNASDIELPSFRGGSGSSGVQASSFETSPQAPMLLPQPMPVQPVVSGGGGGSGSGGGSFDFSLDGDELVVVILVVAAVAAALLAAFWIIYQAPTILADVALNGALSAGLYKRLKNVDEGENWVFSAFKRTALPFVVVGIMFAVAGHYMQAYAPEARSVGGVWQHFIGRHEA